MAVSVVDREQLATKADLVALSKNEYIVAGDHPISYDGRYIGVISEKWIIDRLVKII